MQLEVRKADLLTFEGDGIVVPTICSGEMTLPIAMSVKRKVGPAVEQEVREHAPIAVGACLVTEANAIGARYLIHAPVVEEISARVGVENIRRAVRASLLGATHYEMDKIGIPGFGYGEGAVSHEETARAIIDEVIGYKRGAHPTIVVLMDEDDEMYEAFTTQVGGK